MMLRRVFGWCLIGLTLFFGSAMILMLTDAPGRGEVSAIIEGPLTLLVTVLTIACAGMAWAVVRKTPNPVLDIGGVCVVALIGLGLNHLIWAWYEHDQISKLDTLVASNLARIETDGATIQGMRSLRNDFRLDAARLSIMDSDRKFAMMRSVTVPMQYYSYIVLGDDANALDPLDFYKPYCDAFKTQFAATYVPALHDARFDQHCPAVYPPRD